MVMNPYHKIENVLLRDEQSHLLIEGAFRCPEFLYLADAQWVGTEKVDGTNIRVKWNGKAVSFGGRSDNASLPSPLVERLTALFPEDRLLEKFGEDTCVCLYGEGYGGKIQKGSKYAPVQNFVLFDVRIGDLWLEQENVREIGASLGCDVVPVSTTGTLIQLIDYVKGRPKSAWGDFESEGVVARPVVELKDRRGNRVITKIKCRDFAA